MLISRSTKWGEAMRRNMREPTTIPQETLTYWGWGGAPPGERGDKWLCYGRLSCRTLVVSMLRRVMGECLCAWVGMTKWASEEGNGFAKQCPDASLLSVTRAWRHLSVINAKEKEFPFFWCQWWQKFPCFLVVLIISALISITFFFFHLTYYITYYALYIPFALLPAYVTIS